MLGLMGFSGSPELVMGHFFKTQPNPQKSSPDPTQPIIDTWYGMHIRLYRKLYTTTVTRVTRLTCKSELFDYKYK